MRHRLAALTLLAALLLAALPAGAPAAAPPGAPLEGARRIALSEREGGGEFAAWPSPVSADAWLYLPLEARVALRPGPDGPEPDLELIKFQRVDPANPERLLQGALLHVAFELAADPPRLAALAARVAKEAGAKRADIALAPVREAQLRIEAGSPAAPILARPLGGVGPLSAFTSLRFAVSFDHAAARLVEEMVSSPGGLHFLFDLTAEVPLADAGATGARLAPRPFDLPGAIALAPLPAPLRARLVRDEARDFFARARLVLPAIADDPDLGIDRIQLDVVPVTPAMVECAPIQVFTWTPAAGRFLNRTGEAALEAVFDLPAALDRAGPKVKPAELRFKITRSFEFSWHDPRDRRKTARFKEFAFQPLFDGEAPVATPLTAADVLTVDPGSLSFRALDPLADAAGAAPDSFDFTVKAGNYTVERRIAPRVPKGATRPVPPGEAFVLVPRERRNPVAVSGAFNLPGRRAELAAEAVADLDEILYLPLYDDQWRLSGPPGGE